MNANHAAARFERNMQFSGWLRYTSGGRTPGDHYLWHLDEKGLPDAWQFWVKIIPVGGLRMKWMDWKEMPGGAMLAMTRSSALTDFHFTNVRAGQTLGSVGLSEDIFAPMEMLGSASE
ncbi:MAG: hypothetical protein RLZZ165_1117 [Bacteroidota bacterium]